MKKADLIKTLGVIPAMMTTFDEHENLDLTRAEKFTEFLISKGASGLYIVGSTGEGFLMSEDERKAFAETVIKTVDGRIPVIVHVGAIGTKKSIELAEHAAKAGASAVSSVPPFYYKFSANDVYSYYKELASATDLPFIVYNVPLAGLMSSSFIYRLAEIKNVCGLKFTGQNIDDICEIKHTLGNEFIVYSGCDEIATEGLLAGADGLIGSFYNLMCESFVEIFHLAKKRAWDEAIAIQKIVTRFIHFAVQWDYYQVMRECLKTIGIDTGVSRKPFTTLSAEDATRLHDFCDDLRKQFPNTHIDFIEKQRR
ncbi:MAG: dihydrodipicolinate synthase family protein [Treponema sp.]|nr:dihydrodipicolinate synthase family protein [Treponema sp.]